LKKNVNLPLKFKCTASSSCQKWFKIFSRKKVWKWSTVTASLQVALHKNKNLRHLCRYSNCSSNSSISRYNSSNFTNNSNLKDKIKNLQLQQTKRIVLTLTLRRYKQIKCNKTIIMTLSLMKTYLEKWNKNNKIQVVLTNKNDHKEAR